MSFEKVKSLLHRGMARPQLYKVVIPRTVSNSQFSDEAGDYLRFFCTNVSIPEVSHEFIPVAGQDMMGVMRSQPAQVKYAKPLVLSVIERGDYLLYKQFKQWMDRTAPGMNVGKGNASHRMKYYDDITCDIELRKLEYSPYYIKGGKALQRKLIDENERNEVGYRRAVKVNFVNAYPTVIGDVKFNTEAQNALVRYDVSFTYETYSTLTQDDVDYDMSDDDINTLEELQKRQDFLDRL